MGLAQSTLSEQKTPTPVEALSQQGLIPEAIVSYKISRLADGKNDGEITFGAVDPTKFDASTATTFANINKDGFWEGQMDDVTLDGKSLNFNGGRTAILDTGTTLLVAPQADVDLIHQHIQGAKPDGNGGYIIPCTISQSLALKFGGKSCKLFVFESSLIRYSQLTLNNSCHRPPRPCLLACRPQQPDRRLFFRYNCGKYWWPHPMARRGCLPQERLLLYECR